MAAQGIPCISGILPPSSNYKGLPSSNVRKIAFSSMQSASAAPNSVTKTIYDGRKPSPNELRMSLFLALASQSVNNSQRIVKDLVMETIKYVSPKRLEARNLEELLMAVPDLETVPYKVVKREKDYEVREVQSYYVAETTMPGDTGFDFYGSSQSFNALAAYLFGKNKQKEEMAMTTPVIVQKSKNDGEKMEMTTPVLTRKAPERGKWVMSFVMPSKYGAELPLPVDPSVRIKRMPEKLVAVSVFSGFVSNEEVRHRESKLRASINTDTQIRVKEDALVEVAQYNPPFTPPFMRRNEISLEVEWNQDSTSLR